MSYKSNKFKISNGMKDLNYPIDHVLCQIFKIILSVSSKNMKN